MFAVEEIMKYVPHRYPFLLIGKVLAFRENQSVTTLKNISVNEAQFQGHFPNKPVFPGIYIIENIAQSACFLLAKSAGDLQDDKVYYLGKIYKTSLLKPVWPGDQLITTITMERGIRSGAIVQGVSTVDTRIVTKGEFVSGVGFQYNHYITGVCYARINLFNHY